MEMDWWLIINFGVKWRLLIYEKGKFEDCPYYFKKIQGWNMLLCYFNFMFSIILSLSKFFHRYLQIWLVKFN